MKKLFVFLVVVGIFVYLAIGTPVYAHVLATDGSIGAVMHINPDDDPIAGEQAGFFFEFKDKNNKFDPKNCYCRIDIYENGKVIYSDAIFQEVNPSLNNASFFYTFPQKDVYELKVVGRPRTENAFQPFTLTYNVRVDRSSEQNPSGNSSFFSDHIGLFILTIGFLVFVIIGGLYQRVFKNRNNVHS